MGWSRFVQAGEQQAAGGAGRQRNGEGSMRAAVTRRLMGSGNDAMRAHNVCRALGLRRSVCFACSAPISLWLRQVHWRRAALLRHLRSLHSYREPPATPAAAPTTPRAPCLPLRRLPAPPAASCGRARHSRGHGVPASGAGGAPTCTAAPAAAGSPLSGPRVQPEEQPWPRLHGEVRGAAWGSGRAGGCRHRRRLLMRERCLCLPCCISASAMALSATILTPLICRPAGGLAAQRRQQRHVRSADAAPASVGSGWMDMPESQPPPPEAQVSADCCVRCMVVQLPSPSGDEWSIRMPACPADSGGSAAREMCGKVGLPARFKE